MSFNVAKMQQQAAELDAELARARYTGKSKDELATAVVTGQGNLIDLKIADRAIRGAHPEEIGPAVVEAVAAARRAASQVSFVKMRAVLDKDQEWHPEPVAAPAPTDSWSDEPVQAPMRRPERPEVEEENFEEIDFLDEPESDDRERR